MKIRLFWPTHWSPDQTKSVSTMNNGSFAEFFLSQQTRVQYNVSTKTLGRALSLDMLSVPQGYWRGRSRWWWSPLTIWAGLKGGMEKVEWRTRDRVCTTRCGMRSRCSGSRCFSQTLTAWCPACKICGETTKSSFQNYSFCSLSVASLHAWVQKK